MIGVVVFLALVLSAGTVLGLAIARKCRELDAEIAAVLNETRGSEGEQ